jgi:hydrogenase expression/formation protein HypE
LGKMALQDLTDVLRCIKSPRDVLVPPLPGFDCGVHKLGKERCVVVATDPCINVPMEHFGWLLLHYSASDVSVFGASPQFCTINLLGPPRTHPQVFRDIMRQVCAAAEDLRTTIITGHTGTYDGIDTLLGVCTAYGFLRTRDLITPAGARPGDLILCTKPIGLEVLTNLAIRRKTLATKLFGARRTRYLARSIRAQSCVREAHMLARSGAVSAMHDVTEGGLVAALGEMANASGVGFLLNYRNLYLLSELKRLAKHFGLSRDQLLSMSSTGTLLAAISPKHRERILKMLASKGVHPRVVGGFTKSKQRIIRYNGRETGFPVDFDDPYAEIIGTGA